MQGIEGRVAVVTGASTGIGAAVARALAAAGMRVVLGARRGERLAAVCADIRALGGTAEPVVTDMRDEVQVDALVGAAVERFGQIDALVNNAAIGTLRTVAEGRSDEWRATIETNLLGTLTACRAALRSMLPRGSGDILNVTSASAYEAWPYLAVYAATKAAIHTLSAALRAEVAGSGVRVMSIEVHNVVGTDFASNFDVALLPPALKRWGELGLIRHDSQMLQPEDVARAIVFQLTQPERASIHHLSLRPRAN